MPTPYQFFGTVASLLVLLAAFISNYYFGLSWIAGYLIAINLVAFAMCGYDKGIAHTNATRVPELIFYAVALIGGAAGLLVGMVKFRHKTKKASFQFGLMIILILQLAVARFL